jgi:hypothetical protein
LLAVFQRTRGFGRFQVASFSERPTDVARMRTAARAEYEKRYSVESNYPSLNLIYHEAIATASARRTN